MSRKSDEEVVLDLTPSENRGFDLLFRASKSYLNKLREQIEGNEIDGSYCLVLEFDDVHPVAARVDNYLSGTHYNSIGVADVGLDGSRQETDRKTTLRLSCNRNQLRRFAMFNRAPLEAPITFTVEVPLDNAKAFIRSVEEITD